MEAIVNVDAYDIRRLGVNLMLKEYFSDYQVVESPSLKAFVRQHEDLQPRVVILGGHQTTAQSIQELIRFRKILSDTQFIVYSDLNKGDNLNKYLDLGICGLIATMEVPVELVRCVNAVLDKRKFLSQSLMECFLSTVFYKQEEHATIIRLSRREMQVARYLHNGMKTTWIANYLDLKSSTISTIKRNIFNKLNVASTEELSQKMRVCFPYLMGGERI